MSDDERWTRQELSTVVMALEEFRDVGDQRLADRIWRVLRGTGDEFLIIPDDLVGAARDVVAASERLAEVEGHLQGEPLATPLDDLYDATDRLEAALDAGGVQPTVVPQPPPATPGLGKPEMRGKAAATRRDTR